MPTIEDVLTDPDHGLIPYLDNAPTITGIYQRLQVRPWSFDSTEPSQSTGFRVHEFRYKNQINQSTLTRTVVLGRVFEMASNIDASIEAGLYVEEVCKLLEKAPKCVMYIKEIETAQGSTFSRQNKSNNKRYMIIYIQFDLTYYL